MIEKRYQYYTPNGIEWSKWFPSREDDSEFDTLRNEEKWQIKNKLLNDFRIV